MGQIRWTYGQTLEIGSAVGQPRSAQLQPPHATPTPIRYPLGYSAGMPTCPFTAFLSWPLRRWIVAAAVATGTFLLLGLSTAVIPNPVFGRSIPPTSWAMNVLIATSVLTGLLTATYVAATAPSGLNRKGTAGALLAYLAIGCPVCNKLALIVLGASGAVQFFAPMQPYLAAAGIIALLWALSVRLRGEMTCGWSPPVDQPTQTERLGS